MSEEKDERIQILKWRRKDGYEFVLLDSNKEGTDKIVIMSNGNKVCVPTSRLEKVDPLQVIGLANWMVSQAGASAALADRDGNRY